MVLPVPHASLAFIGGSSTYSINFPEALDAPGVRVRKRDLVFPTPFGDSPPFKLFELSGENGGVSVLTVRMHGWRPSTTRREASRQVFWVLREAGVTRVLAEGGVGAVNHLLALRDLLVANDYLDFSLRRDVSLTSDYLLSMRRPLCPEIRGVLVSAAKREGGADSRVFDRGVYAVTDGRHFESPAEVNVLARLGADMVGQSLAPEVYLAREIGACYARVDLVVNYAEGVVRDWEHGELKEIFYGDARRIGRIILTALRQLPLGRNCECAQLRYPTLLK
jgi:5'-methylthioadenosine phosphorylase